MKKKILILGIIAILIAILVMLTGCGNNDTTQDLSNDAEDDTQTSNATSVTTEKTEIEIKSVKAVSENYAVVTGYDNSTYIIDKEGNYQGTIPLSNDNVLINKDGYIATKPEMGKVNIYDKTGKELFKTDDNNKFYFVITDSNLLLRRSIESSFSGNTSKTEIIDVNGNVKFETDIDGTIEYVGYDLVAKISGNGTTITYDAVYDLKTNTKVDISKLYNLKENSINDTNTNLNLGINDSSYENWSYDIIKQNNNILKIDSNYILNDKNEIIYCDSKDIVISNEYYYDSTQKAICKYDGTVVKDLSDGNGAANIGYYDNKYCIESSTGYYYVLDEGFNRIIEPTQMSVYNINYYRIMSRDSNNTYTILYDYELNNKIELSYKLKKDPKFFVAEIESTNNSSTGYFNLNTQEKLVIYK